MESYIHSYLMTSDAAHCTQCWVVPRAMGTSRCVTIDSRRELPYNGKQITSDMSYGGGQSYQKQRENKLSENIEIRVSLKTEHR